MSIQCEICHKICTSLGGIQKHLVSIHNANLAEYYLKYLNSDPTFDIKCEFCGKDKRFYGFAQGFANTCPSRSCSSKYTNKYHKDKIKAACIERNQKWKEEIIDGKTKQQLILEKGNPIREQKKSITNQKISKALKTKDDNGLIPIEKTMLQKYGVKNPMHLESSKEKIRNTFKEKYNVDWITQSPEIKTKIKNTILEKYGTDNYTKTNEYKRRVKYTNIKKQIEKIQKYFQSNNLEFISDLNEVYKNEKTIIKYKCTNCNTEYEKCWNDIQSWWVCRKCYPSDSTQESELKNFLDTHNIKYIEKARIIKNPDTDRFLELDFYIPDFNLAIEFDGLYWHSTAHQLNNNYHLQKTELCQQSNIQLIHIFEDEWKFKQDIVLSRLKNKLNLIIRKIYARECTIKELSYLDKQKFLNDNHLQGNDISKINLGLYHNDELVSVMTFSGGSIAKGSKSQDSIYELSRFCNLKDTVVIGGASKLLTYFKKNYNWSSIFSYADRRWSDGDVYNKLGFQFLYNTTPNYWYINLSKSLERHHRFTFRKSELKEMKSYKENLTEFEIMELEGYYRIYDCGSSKFEMKNEII